MSLELLAQPIDQMVDPTQGLEPEPLEGRGRHIATGGDERRGSPTHRLRSRRSDQASHGPATAVRRYRRSPSEVDALRGEPGTACRVRSKTTSAGVAEGPIDHAAAIRPRERMSDRTPSRSEATLLAPNRTRATVTDQKSVLRERT
jgi:hypothetical protein